MPDGVEATAKNGNLTLTGTVSYGSERTAAEQAVAYLTGVRNVRDDIDISTDADPVDVTLNVQDALDRYALIPDDSDVAVDTSGNTVALTGHVRTWAEHDAVIDAAWMATASTTSATTWTSPADRPAHPRPAPAHPLAPGPAATEGGVHERYA